MCSKGGGSPPVPNASSTSQNFSSTTTPSPAVAPLYQNFLNQATNLAQTPFNPGMLGQVAPLNPTQTTAGSDIFNWGVNGVPAYSSNLQGYVNTSLVPYAAGMGGFDPNMVQSIMSPYTQDVVGATQNWFNNQNAQQANDLLSQGIRSGNAFGGDRAGVAAAQLGGQQQLAQAPVIANLYQQGYGQALNEYNTLRQMGLQGQMAGLQGEQAALGAEFANIQGGQAGMQYGNMLQQQQQREMDVNQQNQMMMSAYPFQTANWYGSILGGIGPLMGSNVTGYNYATPPAPNALSTGLGIASAGIGLAGALTPSQQQAQAQDAANLPQPGFARGGYVPSLARGGLVPSYFDDGGQVDTDVDDEQKDYNQTPSDSYQAGASRQTSVPVSSGDTQGARRISIPNMTGGQLKLAPRQDPQPQVPAAPGGSTQPQQNTTADWLKLATSGIGLISKAAPLLALAKDGGTIHHYADGGGDDTDDDGNLARYEGILGSPSVVGPARGSPAGGGWGHDTEEGWSPVSQASEVPNLALTRERLDRELQDNPKLRRNFDINTTAEVGTNPNARSFYQALTLDRAAARGRSLADTIRDPGYYPGTTLGATRPANMGPSPSLWLGANPAGYGTGNSSYDPRTGRWVGFAGGPQTGSVRTGSGTETGGIEGPDLAYARTVGYRGPSRTAIGPGGPQGTGDKVEPGEEQFYPPGSREAQAGPTGGQGGIRRNPDGSYSIPGGGKPARTFAQRWASNPFTQLGANLLAQRSPYFGMNLGNAMLGTMKSQEDQYKQDVLDAKPKMHTDTGEVMWEVGGKMIPTGLKTTAGKASDIAAEKEAREAAMPRKTGSDMFGDQYSTYNPETKKWEPIKPAEQPPATAAPAQPPSQPQQTPPPTPPAQPQPTAPAPAPAPQVRQSENQPAWQPGATTPQGVSGAPIKTEPPVLPPEMTANTPPPAPAQPAQTAQPQPAPAPAQPPQAGPAAGTPAPENLQTDQQRDSAARVSATNKGFKSPPAVDPRLLQAMQQTPETFDFTAQQLAFGDTSVLQNYGNSKQAGAYKAALRARAAQYWTDQGLSPREAMAAIAEFGGQKAGARTIANQVARIDTAIGRAQGTASLVTDLSSQVNRTNYPTLNSVIIRAKQETGDTPVRRYVAALETFKNNYAAAMGQGNSVLTDSARRQADAIIDKAFSDNQIQATVGQMLQEMDRELAGTRNAMHRFNADFGGGGSGQPQPAPSGGGGGWKRDPSTGNVQGPDGKWYTSDGKPLQ